MNRQPQFQKVTDSITIATLLYVQATDNDKSSKFCFFSGNTCKIHTHMFSYVKFISLGNLCKSEIQISGIS